MKHLGITILAVISIGAFVSCKSNPTPAPETPVTVETTPIAEPSPPPPPVIESAPPVEQAVATPEPLYLQTIYFDFDSSSVRSDAQDILKKVATSMKSNVNAKVQIEGHCDERGSNEYNLALGERRAKSAKEFLIGEGISSDKLTTKSWGEEKPASEGSSEDTWEKNRRAELVQL